MVIRTKSEVAQRTSGFASWAIGYAELYFSDVLCPDFGIEEFEKSLHGLIVLQKIEILGNSFFY